MHAPRILGSSLEKALRPKWDLICDILQDETPDPTAGYLLPYSQARLQSRAEIFGSQIPSAKDLVAIVRLSNAKFDEQWRRGER